MAKLPRLRRSVGRAPYLYYTLTLALMFGKNREKKTTVRVDEKCLAEQRWARFVVPTWPPFYRRPRLACHLCHT